MADQLLDGFGAGPPVTLTAGAGEIAARLIRSQPSGIVRVSTIQVLGVQSTAAVVATVYLPVFVLRGGASLGVGADGSAALALLRPTSTALVGMPAAVPQGTELLYGGYIRVQNQLSLPLKFGPGEIEARDGQVIAVVMGHPVDGTVAPVVALAGNATLMLSVLGISGALAPQDQTLPPGGRIGRSLPRWDVFENVPNG